MNQADYRQLAIRWFLLLLAAFALSAYSCNGDDDDDHSTTAADDDTLDDDLVDDDATDDDTADDDTVDDDADDDTADDDTVDDDADDDTADDDTVDDDVDDDTADDDTTDDDTADDDTSDDDTGDDDSDDDSADDDTAVACWNSNVCWEITTDEGDGTVWKVMDTSCDVVPDVCSREERDPLNQNIVYREDTGCQGIYDDYCRASFNDHDGKSVFSLGARPCDLNYARCSFSLYDENGNETWYYSTMCAYAMSIDASHYEYDDQDRMTLYQYGWMEYEGWPAWYDCTYYSYDDDARTLTITDGCDPYHTQVRVDQLDEDGHSIHAEVDSECESVPYCTDGIADWCYDFQWEDGRLVLMRIDEVCDDQDPDCQTSSYDTDGRLIARTYDHCDADPPYRCDTWTFDAAGNMLTSQRDDGCDDSPTHCKAWTYDADSRQTHYEYDAACDGIPDSCDTKVYIDIPAAAPPPEEPAEPSAPASPFDVEPDTCLDDLQCWTYTYDPLTGVETAVRDDLCNDTRDFCRTSYFDSEGRLYESYEDSPCDGAPYRHCLEYTYDRSGRVVGWRVDESCNAGTLNGGYTVYLDDLFQEWTVWIGVYGVGGSSATFFDALGRPLLETRYQHYSDTWGALLNTHYTWDDVNRTLSIWADFTSSYYQDYCEYYVYDELGAVIRYRYSEGCMSPSYEYCTEYVRDGAGDPVMVIGDLFCDDIPDSCVTQVFDGDHRMTRQETDTGCNDTIDRCESWSFDQAGRELTHELDNECDDVPDECEYSSWTVL